MVAVGGAVRPNPVFVVVTWARQGSGPEPRAECRSHGNVHDH